MNAIGTLVAPVLTALVCALPWLAPSLGAALDGAELALPGVVTGLALLATIVASVRRTPQREMDGWVWALPALTLLAVAPIAIAWASARSHGAFLLGAIPYSDAGDYLQGAWKLLGEGALDPWNCRRPLNAALFAARLVLVGHSVERAMVLQALLLALGASLAGRAVAMDLGRRAGFTVAAAVVVFGAIYTPTTLSESLGLTLGALALATLWHAARTGRPLALGAGFFALTVALNARSGPFFALGTLLLWAALDARRRGLRALAMRVGAALAGCGLAFAFNTLLLRAHGGAVAGMHGNFSYTLYGLARGGIPWDRAVSEHPAVTRMGEAEAAQYLYARAMEQIRAHPTGLLRGLVVNVHELVEMIVDPLTAGSLQGHNALKWLVFAALVAPAVVLARKALRARPDDAALRMSLAAAAGLALSVPVIFLDGRVRVFAAGFPLGVASLVGVIAALRGTRGADADLHRVASRAPVGLLAALLASALILPRLGRAHPRGDAPACPEGEDRIALWTPGIPLVRTVVSGAGPAVGRRVPEATLDARIGRDPNLGFTQLDAQLHALAPGDSALAALDLVSGRFEYYVFSPEVHLPAREVVRGCAVRPAENIRQFRVVTRVR